MGGRAPVAQWIERWVPDPKVAGSSPVGRAITASGSASANPCRYAAGVRRRPTKRGPSMTIRSYIAWITSEFSSTRSAFCHVSAKASSHSVARRPAGPGPAAPPRSPVLRGGAPSARGIPRRRDAPRHAPSASSRIWRSSRARSMVTGRSLADSTADDLGAHGGVDTDRPELGDDGDLPRGCGNAGFRTPSCDMASVCSLATRSEFPIRPSDRIRLPQVHSRSPASRSSRPRWRGPPPCVLARRTSSTRAQRSSETGGSKRQGAGRRVSLGPRCRRIQPL